MTEKMSDSAVADYDWPVFSLQFTYNPDDIARGESFEPDEVVVYDAKVCDDSRWIAAKRGSYVSIEEIR